MRMPTQNDLPLLGSQRRRLEKLYLKTEYRVQLGERNVSFQLGSHDPVAEALLRKALPIRGTWAILTPCNPRSQEATEKLNSFYHHELRDALETDHMLWLQAVNHDPSGIWPDEPGFLIADAEPLWLQELGRRFHQNALVSTRLGEAPRLVWLA